MNKLQERPWEALYNECLFNEFWAIENKLYVAQRSGPTLNNKVTNTRKNTNPVEDIAV
jgi:hypothetical protein